MNELLISLKSDMQEIMDLYDVKLSFCYIDGVDKVYIIGYLGPFEYSDEMFSITLYLNDMTFISPVSDKRKELRHLRTTVRLLCDLITL